jgi:hypothetical protein
LDATLFPELWHRDGKFAVSRAQRSFGLPDKTFESAD